ncbi:hypothetical protein DFH07DRAFT_853624 [Mycena maculata]|uniref:BRCT domain-containing protein n=1 Tax=Mycena maculata TaxID=230809 RepID=A0AAD7HQA0_9AGAR|nr:hypothetical protein DFH07DRAFT_853624 [Mycena maculata]
MPQLENALFVDSMFGTPLQIYLDKDVPDRHSLVELVKKHGGSVSQGYSGVPYILVDPHKDSGQNLFRQYANKKGKVVLDARWIRECIKAAQLQTFLTNWAGCKVDGTEAQAQEETPTPARPRTRHAEQQQRQQPQPVQPLHIDPLGHSQTHYAFEVYVPPIPPTPPQPWQPAAAIAPEQTHITPAHILHRPAEYREEPAWNHYHQPEAPINPAPPSYDYRYRDDGNGWASSAPYYDPAYVQPYQATYVEEENTTTPEAGPSTLPHETPEKSRGRKRARPTAAPAPPTSSLVANRNPPARSPTPPTRVVKSTYGGNLFTADDVMYLKKYIDYCHEQGLVLSLREICERIAVKAPHHTFYSWRRYCNKHQIRLGGYTMNADRSVSPNPDGDDEEDNQPGPSSRPPGGSIHNLMHVNAAPRNRSPTPPRALFRSTTGKGVAFTDDDITFLVRFMEYRKSQGKLDMVAFWKDVAIKAPHHSRASWMKYWRRHKHELERNEADAPLPVPPDKKMRYSRGDDILLAKHFYNKVEGTSDKIFQAFGRLYPHHPWKGWQEHHRIHKPKIDHFIQRLANGETLEDEEEAPQ